MSSTSSTSAARRCRSKRSWSKSRTNKAAELGVNWAVGNTDSDSTVPIGTFNQSVGNASIGSIAAAIQDPDTLASTGLPTGLTLGAGRFLDNGTNFALLLRALRGDSSTNILQTPSITTLDNEEAEIKVAQEVPFLTGSYSQHRHQQHRHQRLGESVPDHSARRSRRNPQDHAADQQQHVGHAEDRTGILGHRTGHLGRRRPDHEQAHDQHDRHGG